MITLEVCANSYTSAKAAEEGGASRVELCENLAEGGTTPSYAQIKRCKTQLNIEIWPIIRPRGGDFLYSDEEFELMKEDLQICKSLNCEGAVVGLLLSNGEIDQPRCAELIQLASPMPLAFHRAFDMSNDLNLALEALIALGFVRVLTSGATENAHDGIETISMLVKQANRRIEIMPGAGINPDNIHEIATRTGALTFHTSARETIHSKMEYRNLATKMGSINDEYQYLQTSTTVVKNIVTTLKNLR